MSTPDFRVFPSLVRFHNVNHSPPRSRTTQTDRSNWSRWEYTGYEGGGDVGLSSGSPPRSSGPDRLLVPQTLENPYFEHRGRDPGAKGDQPGGKTSCRPVQMTYLDSTQTEEDRNEGDVSKDRGTGY